MAEALEEFFTDDQLTETEFGSSAALIYVFLQGKDTASQTAQKLTAAFDLEGGVTFSDVLEECITSAVEQIPETSDALVQLTTELRALQKGEENLADFDRSLVMSFGERWARYGDPDPYYSYKEELRLAWTSLNYFAARLYSTGITRLAYFGERTLSMTLIRRGWSVNWKYPEITSDSVIALEGHARAAAHWIIVCGQQLYDECEGVRRNWATWVANMAWIVDKEDLNADIKAMCLEASWVMGSIG